MTVTWDQIWEELQDGLKHQPPCPINPEYGRILTLRQKTVNDILEVGDKEVCVRSHHPKGNDKDKDNCRRIVREDFRKWWEHLCREGTASFTGGDRPTAGNSSVVAAILVRCLPTRVAHRGNGTIGLVSVEAIGEA